MTTTSVKNQFSSSRPSNALDDAPAPDPDPSWYSQLTLRTKLILPYLLLGAVLAATAVYLILYYLPQRLPLALVAGLVAYAYCLMWGHRSVSLVAEPIEQLMRASLRLAAGDLSVQIQPATADEIGQLTENVNIMTRQLRRYCHLQAQKKNRAEDLFGRYVGSNIAKHILAGDWQLGGRQVQATVLFADIRDFTNFAENTELLCLMSELNEYYTLMQSVIEEHGGVVNKFGGDSILALFGTPVPCHNHAYQAIQAAVMMIEELVRLNTRRVAQGSTPMRIGIGVNFGEMVVGSFGSDQRREYTVLGDAVNVAKRLSDLNKEFLAETIFVSKETLQQINGRLPWLIEDLGDIYFKGKGQPTTVLGIVPNHPLFVPYPLAGYQDPGSSGVTWWATSSTPNSPSTR